MRRVVALAAAALLLAGCSQVAALAPVGGDRVTGVRYAANDLLVSNGIDVMTAPVCVMATDKGVTCQGTTLDGQDIRVVSTAADQARMVLTVGTRTVYDGDIQAVLDKAMQP
ncbi:MAG: hypothetical protein U0R76_17125 [Candidatus Nanopelagicales bacterium]